MISDVMSPAAAVAALHAPRTLSVITITVGQSHGRIATLTQRCRRNDTQHDHINEPEMLSLDAAFATAQMREAVSRAPSVECASVERRN